MGNRVLVCGVVGTMNKHALLIVTTLVTTSMVGCAPSKTWVYKPEPFQDVPALSAKKAIVLPFEDMRENLNSNEYFACLVPLLPFGWQEYNVPEAERMHMTSSIWRNYEPTEDFAKALATELRNARMFKDAQFGYQASDADIVLRGKIISTMYSSMVFSYGLGIYGQSLWLVGFPLGTYSNELVVELSLVDAKSNGVLFSKSYQAPEQGAVLWIYVAVSDFNYAEMLKSVNQAFIADLKAQSAMIASYADGAEWAAQ